MYPAFPDPESVLNNTSFPWVPTYPRGMVLFTLKLDLVSLNSGLAPILGTTPYLLSLWFGCDAKSRLSSVGYEYESE